MDKINTPLRPQSKIAVRDQRFSRFDLFVREESVPTRLASRQIGKYTYYGESALPAVQTAQRLTGNDEGWIGDGAGISFRRPREEIAVETCERMIDIAAALFEVSGRELREPGRSSSEVSRVRQIAMYVSHVSLRLTMKDVGLGFARDRTTVVYACHLVEDLRDDPEFDRIVSTVEKVAAAALRDRGRV